MSNFRGHISGTAPEIFAQANGKVDGFVCSAGTGGTISGVSTYLKSVNPNVKTFLIDPEGSCLFDYVTKGQLTATGNSYIEGIGIGRLTANFKLAKLDGAFRGTDKEATEMAYYLLRNEGLYLGPSAALNVVGAVKLARTLGAGHTVVTILCDSGERYVSKLYNPAWLEQNNLTPSSTGKSLEFVR